MLKKIIIIFIVLILNNLLLQITFTEKSIPVENIFLDIDKDYKYIKELQTLYDKGMIKPDSDGKFNPLSLLNRDEFVGILTELTCEKCIQPNTNFDLIKKYENTPLFFDINKDNKYYYCIASSTDKGYIQGYQEGSVCDNNTSLDGKKPFCPLNTIVLEEAIAIILRASGILSKEEAEKIEQEIYNGVITENISNDVGPKNIDGSVYSFYPYFKKAVEYEVLDVDINGKTTVYKLVNIVDGKIRPKKSISKEDFLKIAYVGLKANSCEQKTENNLAIKINIYDEICDINKNNCEKANIVNEFNIYDFKGTVGGICELGISEPEGFIWRFYNITTGEEIKKYGKYINNYEFLSNGEWKIFLRVIDNCGNTGEVFDNISIKSENLTSIQAIKNSLVSIDANPIFGGAPLIVDFKAIVGGGEGPYEYIWNFGNGNEGFGKNITNIFKEEGVFKVTLTVKDKNGELGSSVVLIKVNGLNECTIDTDKDGIFDCEDVCPLIKGDIKNKGCPILETTCNDNNKCNNGFVCSFNNTCLPEEIKNKCDYNGGSVIGGNLICNSCPCEYFLDFKATLRKCDIIFPAITSQDNKTIFSKGELFQIK